MGREDGVTNSNMMGFAVSTAEIRKTKVHAEARDVHAENTVKGIPVPQLLIGIAIGGIPAIAELKEPR